jgi:Uncharacterized protein with protein kinase and helix-hairpin-helix DNA-binding domains
MLTVYDSKGKSYELTNRIGVGGEGAVYSLPDDSNTVAKIFHEPISNEKAEKLRWMAANKNEQLQKVAAWIEDTLHSEPNGKIVGFLMPNVRAKEIHELYSLKSRRIYFPRATWRFLIHTAANVARAFYVLHKNSHVMGDVNHGNCVVLTDGTVKLIDCDSYSIYANGRRYACEVGVGTHLAPELQGKNLADVERLPVHDNFGLAVIIFQLLFLGRHPFAGTLLTDEEKSLEECIREKRFAYARKAHQWEIRRPPGTLSLDAVGPRLASMFERAFLTEERPEPREWIEALEDLSKSLKRCSLHTGHYYFRELHACPFCEIEAQTGLMLFPFVSGEPDMGEGFNIFTIENLLANFSAPQPLPLLQTQNIPLPPPSPELKTEKMYNRMRVVMFACAQSVIVTFLLLSFGNFAALYVGFILVTVFIAVNHQSYKSLREIVGYDLEAARRELNEIENEWTQNTTAQYEKNISLARQKIAEYKKIQRQSRRKLKNLQKELFRCQLDLHLSKFKIEEAAIDGIGQNEIRKLKISGIKTAADVSESGFRLLKATSDETISKLLEWRKNLESKFEFKAEEIPEEEKKRITAEFAEKSRSVERDIEQLLGNLRSGSLALRHNRRQSLTKLEAATLKLRQAESDLKAIGTGIVPTIALLAVTSFTFLIGNFVQNQLFTQTPTHSEKLFQDSDPPPPKSLNKQTLDK